MLRVGSIFKIVYIFLITSFMFSCNVTKKGANLNQNPSDNPDQAKPIIHLIYKDIIENSKLNFLMIPVGISPDQNSNHDLPFLVSRDPEKNDNIYNLIFYHKTNNQSHILLNKKAVINSFEFLEIPASKSVNTAESPETPGQQTRKYWLYRLIDTDSNGDGKLTPEDATIGYVSTGDGKNLIQVTPNNTQMKSWKIMADMNAILILVTFDTDNDKQFSNRDRSSYIRVNLDKLQLGQQMIDPQTEQQIKSILEQ